MTANVPAAGGSSPCSSAACIRATSTSCSRRRSASCARGTVQPKSSEQPAACNILHERGRVRRLNEPAEVHFERRGGGGGVEEEPELVEGAEDAVAAAAEAAAERRSRLG